MNPVFAALAVVAFGLMVVGGDASAAPQPSHPAPARKSAPAAKPAAKPAAPKAASKAAAQKAAPPRTTAAKAPAAKAPAGKNASAKAAPPARTGSGKAAPPVASRAEPQKGGSRAERADRQGPVVAEKPEPRDHGRGRGRGHQAQVKEAPVKETPAKEAPVVRGGKATAQAPAAKGRAEVVAPAPRRAEPSRPLVRIEPSGRSDAPVGREAFKPAGREGIGREAFTPTAPPIPRSAALRQLQQAPYQPPAPAPRPAVTPPSVAPAVAASAQPAPLKPTVELPKAPPARQVVQMSSSNSSLSGPEMAAAAAAAVSAARASEAAPATPPAAAPAPAPAPAPAAQPSSPAVPLATPTAPPSRPARGAARAYAMDGATFYQGGRKIRVQGLDVREPGMTSEHATQRLQRALDAGSLSVEPVEVDGSGHTVAIVRVNGRNVADAVRASAN